MRVLALTLLALLLAGCSANESGSADDDGDATAEVAPGRDAPMPYEVGNASYELGAPNVGPVNTTVVLEVKAPANATTLLVNVTFETGATTGFRFSGLGDCAHEYGNVAATGQTVSVPCEGVPPGPHDLAFVQTAGRVAFRVVVLALPSADAATP